MKLHLLLHLPDRPSHRALGGAKKAKIGHCDDYHMDVPSLDTLGHKVHAGWWLVSDG